MSIIYKITFKEIDETFPTDSGKMARNRETVCKESFELLHDYDFNLLKEQCRRVEQLQYNRED